MFETGVRQLRMALGMVWGRRLDPGNIGRLVDDALATMAEFGDLGADARMLTEGADTDPAARRQLVTSGLRRTARRLAVQSPFYSRRFTAADVHPDRLDADGLGAIPVTVKAD
ncbi:MAG TPA: hypothetical protein VH442_03690, partial [Micromonosporaceae bacterium]